jgi:hypothetical protein
MDYIKDESYTPCDLVLMAGDHASTLHEFSRGAFTESSGWMTVPLMLPDNSPLQCFSLRIQIKSNNNNGRDSRIHGVRFLA